MGGARENVHMSRLTLTNSRISELENKVKELQNRIAEMETALNQPLATARPNVVEAFTNDCTVSSVIVDGKDRLDAAWDCRYIASDGANGLYITDEKSHAVRHIDANGRDQAIAGTGGPGFGNGLGKVAQFHNPNAIAVARDGTLYIADYMNHVVRKVSFEVRVNTLAGYEKASGYADEQGKYARFCYPVGCAVGPDGDVYISDAGGHRIRCVSRDGTVTTVAGSGAEGFTDGQGKFAEFKSPLGITVDVTGHVFVADCSNHVIRRIAPDGTVKTYAGNGTSGFQDGARNIAQFNAPHDVAVDSDGTVYVADTHNHAIRCILPSGTVTTIAGTGQDGFTDGTGRNAHFSYPQGITLGTDGSLYVMDRENKRIRKLVR